MLHGIGVIFKHVLALALLISLVPPPGATGQEGILDSSFTFRAGTMKTVNALNLITRQTGYNFTYDSRLVNPGARSEMNFNRVKLRLILDSIMGRDSLVYSVIDRFIIISRAAVPPSSEGTDTLSVTSFSTLSGLILDDESSEPLQFATISLKHGGRGTVTNNNGEFGLKLQPADYADTIVVSFLGYLPRNIPVRQSFGNNFVIGMKREYIPIPGIIIKNQIPREILNKTIAAIPANYGNTPAGMTAFYREGVLRKTKLQTYSEAVLQIFKSPYSATFLKDQIRILKSRKVENINISDSITVRLKAGLSTCLELDGMRNTFDFLSYEPFNEDYTYRLTDIVSYDEESAFEIEFSPREGAGIPMFSGSMFINTTDYALVRAEFMINPGYLQKMRGSFISNPSRNFSTWPVSVKYTVSYRKINDRYFLNHVRGDLEFLSKQRKRLFNVPFNVFFEMAITSVTTENVTRFEREKLAPVHDVFSRTIKDYDPVFWGKQDFLKPEENLLQALKNMQVRLLEYSE